MMHRMPSKHIFFCVLPAAIYTRDSAFSRRCPALGYDRAQCLSGVCSPVATFAAALPAGLLTADLSDEQRSRVLRPDGIRGLVVIGPLGPVAEILVTPRCGELPETGHRGRSLLAAQGRGKRSLLNGHGRRRWRCVPPGHGRVSRRRLVPGHGRDYRSVGMSRQSHSGTRGRCHAELFPGHG